MNHSVNEGQKEDTALYYDKLEDMISLVSVIIFAGKMLRLSFYALY